MSGKRTRLDRLVHERGLADSRTRAQALVLAGKVVVDDHTVDKPGALVDEGASIRVRGDQNPFVSRGGLKLRAALDAFAIAVGGRIAIDVGASTGGFTDCLLQAGAARVHAVDVGHGQLSWKLASDDRVVVHDRTNIRALAPEAIGEKASLLVADCSFISLEKVLPHVSVHLENGADLVVLVKPQFEVGREHVGKGGIVRDAEVRRAAVRRVLGRARELGFAVMGEIESPVPGRDGNIETLAWLRLAGEGGGA